MAKEHSQGTILASNSLRYSLEKEGGGNREGKNRGIRAHRSRRRLMEEERGKYYIKLHISSNSNKFSVIKNKSIKNEEWGAAEWPGQPAHHLSEHAVHRGYPKLSQG